MAAQEYRISSELQRCCWYVVLSTPALAAVLVWVGRFVQGRGAGGMDPRLVLWAALACAAASAFNWRLRLDECGIARRRLFRWDLWTWDDLASGRIPKMHVYVLADPARPWWRRRLNLGCMAADDIQTVLAAINARYRLPPPPDLPDRLAITWGFRQRAVLDHNGLELLVCGCRRRTVGTKFGESTSRAWTRCGGTSKPCKSNWPIRRSIGGSTVQRHAGAGQRPKRSTNFYSDTSCPKGLIFTSQDNRSGIANAFSESCERLRRLNVHLRS